MGTKILNGDWILEIGSDRPIELNMGKRYDPFEGLKSLQDIFLQDMVIHKEDDPKATIIAQVTLAMEQLDKEERVIIEEFYYMGVTIPDLSVKLNRNENVIKHMRNVALEKLKVSLRKSLYNEDDEEVHTTCPICNDPRRQEVNIYLHLWYDYKRGILRGLTKSLRKVFGPELADPLSNNPKLVECHLEKHIGVGMAGRRKLTKKTKEATDAMASTSKPTTQKGNGGLSGARPDIKTPKLGSKDKSPLPDNAVKPPMKSEKVTITVLVEEEVKDRVFALATASKLPQSFIVKEIISLGLPLLESLNHTRGEMIRSLLRMGKETEKVG